MQQGKLSYSKVRALTRVATPDNEAELLVFAMSGTAAHVETLVRAWRRVDRYAAVEEGQRIIEHRRLSTFIDDDGMLVIRARLAPEVGALFQKALDAAMEGLYQRSRHEETSAWSEVPVELRILDTTISGGSTTAADQPGGGFFVEGGAYLYLDRCTVSGNSADSGGGIYNEGTVYIGNSLVTQNTAVQSGAGLENHFQAGIINSTFSGNTLTAAAASKGIAVNQMDIGNVTINLSTFSGNSSDSASSSTLKGLAGSVSVADSIIANTVGGGVACLETADQQLNKDDDGTCGGGGDLTGLDPVLAENGGPTQTHALLAGSNAIDHAGDCGQLQDQRGFLREQNLCDSGAYEFSPLFKDGFESGDTSAWADSVP